MAKRKDDYSPFRQNRKLKTVPPITVVEKDVSAALLESPLTTFSPLPENDPETWGEGFENQSNLEFSLLLKRISESLWKG